MIKAKKLILCIDRDNDLYEKAKISGPIIGREANLNAATKLILHDATETDANAIFRAINLYDQLSGEMNVEIATLTGSSALGYAADREIVSQLEKVLAEFPADSCIFVSDGASDEQIIPILKSRIKIDSIELVVMKQAKELEKTYFVILEKLKEPHYARLIFGIPALILILFATSRYFGLGIEIVAGILGLYLALKAFGIEEKFYRFLSGFKFSIDKISSIAYILFILLLLVSFWASIQTYTKSVEMRFSFVKIMARVVQTFVNFVSIAAMVLIAGKIIDVINEKRQKIIDLTKYGLYAINIIILWFVLSTAADWVLLTPPGPYVSFADFLLAIVLSIVISFIGIYTMKKIKINTILKMNLENKEIFSENGTYLGKTIGVEPKEAKIIFKTPFGQKLNIPIELVISIDDRILVKT
jgi:putative membrane protein